MKHTPLLQASCDESQTLLTHVIAFFEELLLSTPTPAPPRTGMRSGRPATLTLPHLWLGCLLGILTQAQGLSAIWHLLVLRPLGSFAPLSITYDAVRRRLLQAKIAGVQALLEQVNAALCARRLPASAVQIASFSTEIYALDESSLDALARLCHDVKDLAASSPSLRVGKIAGLFNLRSHQWTRIQFRSDALAHCKTGAFLLLEAVPKGSLILADFGLLWLRLV